MASCIPMIRYDPMNHIVESFPVLARLNATFCWLQCGWHAEISGSESTAKWKPQAFSVTIRIYSLTAIHHL